MTRDDGGANRYFSYAFVDLNKDGTDEMVIGADNNGYHTVNQVFAIGKKDGRVHLVASAGYRTYISIHTDGSWMWGGSGGTGLSTQYIYRIKEPAETVLTGASFSLMALKI